MTDSIEDLIAGLMDAGNFGNRKVDAQIYNEFWKNEFYSLAFQASDWSRYPRLGRGHDGWLIGKDENDLYANDLPRFTRSLDAALELAERIAPDHFPGVQKHPNGWGAEMVYPEPRKDRHGKHFAICSDDNWRPNPAIALCIAALRASQRNCPAHSHDAQDTTAKE